MRQTFFGFALTASLLVTPVVANEGQPTLVASDADQAIKCRKIQVTGSLVKRGKVCKTIAEWKRIQDSGNNVARSTWEGGLVCSGGECRGIEPTGP